MNQHPFVDEYMRSKLEAPRRIYDRFPEYDAEMLNEGAWTLDEEKNIFFRVFFQTVKDIVTLISPKKPTEFMQNTTREQRSPQHYRTWLDGEHTFGLAGVCTVMGWSYDRVRLWLLPLVEEIPPLEAGHNVDDKRCLYCFNVFSYTPDMQLCNYRRQMYCSIDCGRRGRKAQLHEKICPVCFSVFQRKKTQGIKNFKLQAYCSQSCFLRARTFTPEVEPEAKECKHCHQMFTRSPKCAVGTFARKEYCNKDCVRRAWAEVHPRRKDEQHEKNDSIQTRSGSEETRREHGLNNYPHL